MTNEYNDGRIIVSYGIICTGVHVHVHVHMHVHIVLINIMCVANVCH